MEFSPFNQPPPTLGNQYQDDAALRSYLKRTLPQDVHGEIENELDDLGALAGGELYRDQLADRLNEPVLTQWSPWGERIDHIELSPLWKKAKRIAAERGLIATPYEARHGRFSRVHQFALVYLFSPSTDVYSCPLAMSDGAAFTLRASGNQKLVERALPRLMDRNPDRAWTSGQWMTESTGGSDVGRSETLAKQDSDGQWRLYGRKWFTSAATSEMTLTLGRPEGGADGGRGLALFYLETRDEEGRLRNIELNRLKDKLGTRKVPTAELLLQGTPAELVAEPSGGIRNIAPMLNITRTWNAVTSVAGMRRGLALARDFAKRRVAFKAPLSEKPLHLDTLAALQAEFEGALHLAFWLTELIGREEHDALEADQARLLRMLTPLAKLTTAKQAVTVASEVLESFGGAGYVEDTGLPTLLRDAQVLPIWEGTTNVLALDVLRALGKDPEALGALGAELGRRMALADRASLAGAREKVERALEHAGSFLREAMQTDPGAVEAGARNFALTLGRATELALLVEHAVVTGEPRARAAAARFADTRIDRVVAIDRDRARLLALA
ncbi:MAG: acyl-CoA dehydrogenase family protein [Myxococcota bacterium]